MLPGVLLLRQSREKNSDQQKMRQVFEDYRRHHNQWIRNDAKRPGYEMDPRDLRWLEHYRDDDRDIK